MSPDRILMRQITEGHSCLACVYVCMCARACLCLHVCVCVCVYVVYLCVCVSVCVRMHRCNNVEMEEGMVMALPLAGVSLPVTVLRNVSTSAHGICVFYMRV